MDKIKEDLVEEYGEVPSAAGENNGVVLVLFSNVETKTFTIVAMKESGLGCPLFSGDSWHELPKGRSEAVRP